MRPIHHHHRRHRRPARRSAGRGRCTVRWSARRSRRAFSLLEVVIVIVLLGIVSAVAMPQFGESQARHRVEAAASRIAADIAQTQAAASAFSSSRTITFNAPGAYTITGVAALERPTSASATVRIDAPPYSGSIVSATFGTNQVALTFNGFGTPDNAGSVIVRCGRHARQIDVAAGSGAVSVSRCPPPD